MTVVLAVLTAIGVFFAALALGASTWDAIYVEFGVYVLIIVVTEVRRYRRFKRWMREQ